MAPVEPADITAPACPRRTSCKRVLGRLDRDASGRAELGQKRPQQSGPASQHDPGAELPRRRDRAGHDGLGRVIAAHRIDRDQPGLPGLWRGDAGRLAASIGTGGLSCRDGG
jgi:hypothetical protein